MPKKIFLGTVQRQIYMTQTGTHYIDQKTFESICDLTELDNFTQDTLDKIAKKIDQNVGRKTRPFELYLSEDFQSKTDILKKYLKVQFPRMKLKEYKK